MKKAIFAVATAFCLSAVPGYAAPVVEAVQGQAPTVVACPVNSNGTRNDTSYQIIESGASITVDQSCRTVSIQELADQGIVIAHGIGGQPARFEFKR